MSAFLLMDWGASRVKTALVDTARGRFSLRGDFAPPPGRAAPAGRFEIPLHALEKLFHDICGRYLARASPRVHGILMCSQMHGFVLCDGRGRPLTGYVSWKDQRSLETPGGGESTFALVRRLAGGFERTTGMRPRPGLPFMNALHLARQSALPSPCRVLSLPEWLASTCEAPRPVAHPTMLAGSGFFDVAANRASDELRDAAREATGVEFVLNGPAGEREVAAEVRAGATRVPLFVGVGDFPCAVLGAGNRPRETLSVNIGTGSQVSMIDAVPGEGVEVRPYFDGRRLAAVTHIPAGRALSEHVAFLEDVARRLGARRPDAWGLVRRVTEADVLRATLDVDLALFPGARGYRDGGRVGKIGEGSLTARHWAASLVRALALQYVEVARAFDLPPHAGRLTYVVSGGVPRKIRALPAAIGRLAGRPVRGPARIDETLLGLRALALVAEGRARDLDEARRAFERETGRPRTAPWKKRGR